MKKYWALILRSVVAVGGICFIAGSLTWHDQLALPAGFTVHGHTLSQPATAPVVEITERAVVIDTGSLDMIRGEGPAPLAVSRDRLGRGRTRARFEPGVLTTIGRVDGWLLAGSLLCLGLVFPMQAGRWLMLMRCRRMPVRYARAFRLTMAGLFFNFCMPGMTGGDVVKAYYAARNSHRRTTAVISVLFDRLAGLVGLLLLAALVGLTMWDQPLVRRITLGLWLALFGLVGLAVAYQSLHLRRALQLERLAPWLPGREALVKVDEAVVAYRHHKPTVGATILLSVPVQVCLMLSAALAGQALGVGHGLGLLLAVLPLVFLAGAVPITFQGIGVMEWLTLALLQEPELATANQLVGMLLVFRLCMFAYALLGSLVLLHGDIHLFPDKAERGTAA